MTDFTGWPPGLMQDDCRKLSRWFASRLDARWVVDQLGREIRERKAMSDTLGPPPEPDGWILDGRPDGLEFKRGELSQMDTLLRSTAPMFTAAQLEAERQRCYQLGVAQERERSAKLWRLLDDIDTLDDACRFDSEAFREMARAIQRRRFEVMTGEEFDAAISGA